MSEIYYFKKAEFAYIETVANQYRIVFDAIESAKKLGYFHVDLPMLDVHSDIVEKLEETGYMFIFAGSPDKSRSSVSWYNSQPK